MESVTLYQSNPVDPAGTSSATAVMMGLSGALTPRNTGRMMLMISGTIFNAGIGQGATVRLSYGTGVAPANGAALTGTQVGGLVKYISGTIAAKSSFALNALVTGLTVNTALWLDLALAATTAGTATVTDLSLTAMEL